MRRLIIILTISLTVLNYCYSQGHISPDSLRIRRSSVFLEIGGNSKLYSINYDYLLTVKNKFKTAMTIGIAGYKGYPNIDLELSPQFNILIGGKLCAEIGVGYTRSVTIIDREGYSVLRFGARYQKTNGGFFGRFAITPILIYFGDLPVTPWVGLSIGYTIK